MEFIDVLQVSLCGRCGLSCIMCGQPRRDELMSMETVFALQRGLLEFPRPPILALAVRGEAMAHPQFPELLLQLARRGTDGRLPFRELYLDSNGQALDGPRIRSLLEVHRRLGVFVRLTLSIDAAGAGTYARIRRGGNWQRLLDGLERVLRLRRAGRQTVPAVNCQFIVMKENAHEAVRFRHRFAALFSRFGTEPRLDAKYPEHQQDCLSFVQLHPLRPTTAELAEARRLHLETLDRLGIPAPAVTERAENEPCVWPFYMAVIREDGRVLPCCLDTGEELVMGELSRQSLGDIFRGDAYRRLRRAHARTGEALPPRCRRCPDQLVVERAGSKIARFLAGD